MSGDNLTIALFFVGLAITLISLGISQAGWKHPVLIGAVFLLGFLCLGFGAFWPEIREASPDAFQKPIIQIGTNPESWFFLFVLILVIWIIPKHPAKADMFPGRPKKASQLAVSIDRKEQEKPKSFEARIFTGKTPFELVKIYQDHTAIQAKPLVEPFLGLWIYTAGNCFSVNDSKEYLLASLYPDDSLLAIRCKFSNLWRNDLLRVQKKENVHVLGQIVGIDSGLSLENCEIINPQAELPPSQVLQLPQ
jgi:hypothetical protein